jgi:hypothetical protein
MLPVSPSQETLEINREGKKKNAEQRFGVDKQQPHRRRGLWSCEKMGPSWSDPGYDRINSTI